MLHILFVAVYRRGERHVWSTTRGREGSLGDDTTTAAPAVRVIFRVEACWASPRSSRGAWSAELELLVVPPNLTDETAESLVDIDPLFCRGLDESASKVLGEIATLVHAHLPLILQIALVCHNDDREGVSILDAKDLLMERADFLERVARRDGVDEEETFSGSHVLLPHSAILLLTSGV